MKLPRKKLVLLFIILSICGISQAQIKAGESAPELLIKDWIKNVPDDKNLKGKFIIIDFWATWCAPCLETVPHMNELVAKNKSRRDLVFLALTDEKKEIVNPLLKRISFSAAVVNDPSRKIFDDYKIDQIPTCVIIDDTNMVKWVGHPSKLNNDIIKNILNRENPDLLAIDKNPTPERASKVADSLSRRYGAYFNDDEIKEYFNFGPLSVEKEVMNFSFGTRRMSIGYTLKRELSGLLKVSDNQIILPASLSKARISYIYKSKEQIKDNVLLNLLLDKLNMKYSIVDTLVEVMQLEVVDKGLLKKSTTGDKFGVSRVSSSTSYIGVLNGRFSAFKREIEEAFDTIVVAKNEKDFEEHVSITFRRDNLEGLKASLKTYGIEVSFIKKHIKGYVFIPK